MAGSRRSKWLVFAGAAVLLAALVVFVALSADLNRNKPRLERAASNALGMDVRIDGRVDVSLFPRLHLGLRDARVLGPNGATVLEVKRVRAGIAWRPLLQGKLRLNRVELLEPRLSVRRDLSGELNLDRLSSSASWLGALDGAKLSLSNGTVLYTNAKTGTGWQATGIGLKVTRLQVPPVGGERPWAGSIFDADIRCDAIQTNHLRISALRASVVGKDGVFDFTPVTLELFDGRAEGSLRADVSGEVPAYRMAGRLSRFRIEESLHLLSPKAAADGEMDFTARLSMRGRTRDQLVRTAGGEISLRGRAITLTGNDIDRDIARFQAGRTLNLGDVGGVLLVGPLSLIVTRGYGFAGLFMSPGGKSTVQMLTCDWSVEHGIAQAKDVALATKQNRIALKGRLDFVRERYDGVTIAALDGNGCALVKQAVHGSFQKPTVERPNLIGTIAGPVFDVFGRIRRVLPGKDCDNFYAGSVTAPE